MHRGIRRISICSKNNIKNSINIGQNQQYLYRSWLYNSNINSNSRILIRTLSSKNNDDKDDKDDKENKDKLVVEKPSPTSTTHRSEDVRGAMKHFFKSIERIEKMGNEKGDGKPTSFWEKMQQKGSSSSTTTTTNNNTTKKWTQRSSTITPSSSSTTTTTSSSSSSSSTPSLMHEQRQLPWQTKRETQGTDKVNRVERGPSSSSSIRSNKQYRNNNQTSSNINKNIIIKE